MANSAFMDTLNMTEDRLSESSYRPKEKARWWNHPVFMLLGLTFIILITILIIVNLTVRLSLRNSEIGDLKAEVSNLQQALDVKPRDVLDEVKKTHQDVLDDRFYRQDFDEFRSLNPTLNYPDRFNFDAETSQD